MYIFQCKDERKHRNDIHFLYLVFCHIALGFDDVLDACGHAVTQFLEVGNVHVQNPQLLDLLAQLEYVARVLAGKLHLHLIPGVFDRVKVWGVSWPLQNLNLLFLEPS